jgi:hypothetical protein
MVRTDRVPDFIALMKPRVMVLSIFTAAVGLFIAPGDLGPLVGAVSIIGIAAGAGAAGVLNMWYDADIDATMTRTARRPIPDGKVSRAEALGFGLALACSAVAVLALARNVTAAALLAFRLHRRVYDLAEASDTSEHRHRWRRRRSSVGDWLGGGNRSHRARAAHPAPDHHPVDPTAFLGTLADAHRRLRPCGRADAARCRWERHNGVANSCLQRALGPDVRAPVRSRVCGDGLWRDCRCQRNGLHRARCPAEQEPRDGSSGGASPVRLLHFLSLLVVCGPLGRPPNRSLANDGHNVRRSD